MDDCIHWSTFMPTGDSQAAMEIVIVVIYWYIHASYLPFKTDWKDDRGNLLPEKKMQHLVQIIYSIGCTVLNF